MNGRRHQFPCSLGLVAAIVLAYCPAVPAQSPPAPQGDSSLAAFKTPWRADCIWNELESGVPPNRCGFDHGHDAGFQGLG